MSHNLQIVLNSIPLIFYTLVGIGSAGFFIWSGTTDLD